MFNGVKDNIVHGIGKIYRSSTIFTIYTTKEKKQPQLNRYLIFTPMIHVTLLIS